MPNFEIIKGLVCPMITPFNQDLSVNTDAFVKLAKDLIDHGGSEGIAPFGTTGEALSVSLNDRMINLSALVEAGIDPAVMMPGTGLNNLEETAILCRQAAEYGCYGTMTLPPFYFTNVSDDGLYDYYSRLIDRVNHNAFRIFLYHIPQTSGMALSIDLVRRLHQAYPEHVVGVKDSSGNWENTKALLSIDGLVTYPGAETPLFEALTLGAPGCISATGNFNGRLIAEVINLFNQNDHAGAEKRHEDVKAIRDEFAGYPPIPMLKALKARTSGDMGWNRLCPPMMALDINEVADLEMKLKVNHGFGAV